MSKLDPSTRPARQDAVKRKAVADNDQHGELSLTRASTEAVLFVKGEGQIAGRPNEAAALFDSPSMRVV